MYSSTIIHHFFNSNQSANNQRDIVLDTAENITQIGKWTRDNFNKEHDRIQLFLVLTRKNLNALREFQLSPSFTREFVHFCNDFDRLEKDYLNGMENRSVWAGVLLKWGTALVQSAKNI